MHEERAEAWCKINKTITDPVALSQILIEMPQDGIREFLASTSVEVRVSS